MMSILQKKNCIKIGWKIKMCTFWKLALFDPFCSSLSQKGSITSFEIQGDKKWEIKKN
jgi:hypothetical protein